MKRTQMPPRSVPLLRTATLTQGSPLARTGQLQRSPRRLAVVRADGAAAGGGVVVPLRRPRVLEYIPRDVRRMVLERDGYACVCCGVPIAGRHYSLNHRLRSSQGGQAETSNLITVLGLGGEACHGRIDLYRDPEDGAKGYRIRSGIGPDHDPLYVPVTLFDGRKVWLTSDGHYADEPPEDGAA